MSYIYDRTYPLKLLSTYIRTLLLSQYKTALLLTYSLILNKALLFELLSRLFIARVIILCSSTLHNFGD